MIQIRSNDTPDESLLQDDNNLIKAVCALRLDSGVQYKDYKLELLASDFQIKSSNPKFRKRASKYFVNAFGKYLFSGKHPYIEAYRIAHGSVSDVLYKIIEEGRNLVHTNYSGCNTLELLYRVEEQENEELLQASRNGQIIGRYNFMIDSQDQFMHAVNLLRDSYE